jgi:hypothetical protein
MAKKAALKKSHAKYAPSTLHRVMECPGSVELSAPFPNEESAAAKHGTDGHTCLDMLLKNGPNKQLATERFLREKYPAQMVIHAAWAAKEIWKRTPKGAQLLSETKSECFHIDPHLHGTTDAVIIEDFGTLHVIDYKYGVMPVEVEDNPQILAYAIGIAHQHDYNFDRVICTIIQPRANHGHGPVRSWVTSIENLLAWAHRFKKGIQAAKHPEAPFKAGEHCFFCPAKEVCLEYSPEATGSIRSRFITPPSPEAKRKQMLLDFGSAPITNNKKTTKVKKTSRTKRV